MLINSRDMVKTLPHPNTDGGADMRETFWQLWVGHQPFLLKLCLYWMKGDVAEAQEALSGAMMRALEGTPDKLPEIGNVRAWLAKIVRNHCIDLLRQQKGLRLEAKDADYLLHGLDERNMLLEASPEMNMVQGEAYHQILRAVEGLPLRLREVMMLRAYQNMPFKEIALHLSITPANARKRATQARSLLSQRLRADENDVRPARSADPSGSAPRGERRAADAIMERPVAPATQAMRYAHTTKIQLAQGRVIERILFLSRRPARIEQRLKTLKNYMGRHPSGWTKNKEYADLLCILGRFSEAALHYQDVLQRQPQLVLVGESLARCLQVLGQSNAAIQVLKSLHDKVTNPAYARHIEALAAYMEGNHRALAAWKQACQLDPGHLHYTLCLSAHLLRLRRSPEAKIKLQQHLRHHPMDREGYHLLLAALCDLNKPKEYAAVLQQVTRKFPGDLLVSVQNVIFTLFTHEVSKEEMQELGKKISIMRTQWPQAALVMHARAAWLFYRHKTAQCRAFVLGFIAQQPKLREGLKYASYWLDRLGEKELAAQYLGELNHIFPHNSPEIEIQNLNTWQNQSVLTKGKASPGISQKS
ncbi:MAG TPA: sigma-70 family RNA polymerase sigma factor [Bacteroidetes bacterium]|nr:sigma-70 family RNA polymerase sigma factor [Bacteroidota bacterium]